MELRVQGAQTSSNLPWTEGKQGKVGATSGLKRWNLQPPASRFLTCLAQHDMPTAGKLVLVGPLARIREHATRKSRRVL